MTDHRHKYEVTRRVQNTDHALVKRCRICEKTIRYHRGRWIVTQLPKEKVD